MNRDPIDTGRKPDVTSDEHTELVEARRRIRVLEIQNGVFKRASAYRARENVLPKMRFRPVYELAADGIPVAVAGRLLNSSRSRYYDCVSRPPSAQAVADSDLTTTICRIHVASRETYGASRVLAEVRLCRGVHVGGERVARHVRLDGLAGIVTSTQAP